MTGPMVPGFLGELLRAVGEGGRPLPGGLTYVDLWTREAMRSRPHFRLHARSAWPEEGC